MKLIYDLCQIGNPRLVDVDVAEEEVRMAVAGVEAEAGMEGGEEGATRRMLVLGGEGVLVEVVPLVEAGLVAEEVR